MQNTFSQQAGRWIAGLKPQDLSQEQQDRLQAMLLFSLAVTLAGNMPADPTQRALKQLYATPGSTPVFGSDVLLSLDDATALHAVRGIAAGQVDTHPATMGHIASIVIPPMLTLAHEARASRDDLVSALWAGLDLPPRLGLHASPATSKRGFRGTTLFGMFGAAAACSRVLRLNAEQSAHALGIAVNFASGLTQCFAEGSGESATETVQASRAGLHAARLAAVGIKAAPHALEGDQGFYRAYAGEVPPPLDFTGWTLDELVIKVVPGCHASQVPVLLLQQLMERHNVEGDQVERVTVHLHPQDASYPGVMTHGPFTGRMGALMSAPFVLTLALTRGCVRFADFEKHYGAGDSIHERSRCVEMRIDPELPLFRYKVGLRLRNGNEVEASASAQELLLPDLLAMRKLCPQLVGDVADAEQVAADLVLGVEKLFSGEFSVAEFMKAFTKSCAET